MKTIGLIGGMSWESTSAYYRALNEGVKAELGGLHSAKIAMFSVDFDEIEKLQHSGDWAQCGNILAQAGKAVEAAGADFVLIGTNTMHKVADDVQAALSVPLIHIADATAEQLLADGIGCVGLLGTRFTMEQDFYKGRLQDKFGIDVLVPSDAQQSLVHDVIYNELCLGEIKTDSRTAFIKVIADLAFQGAEAVILGCTEIAMLVQQEHSSVKLYDTTEIHAAKAVSEALA